MALAGMHCGARIHFPMEGAATKVQYHQTSSGSVVLVVL